MNYRQYMDASNAEKVFTTFNRVFRTGESTSAFNWELIAKDGRRYLGRNIYLPHP